MCKVFFFCCAPLGAAIFRRGQSKKQFFFAPAPGKGKGRRSPVGSRHGARAKKKHHPKKKTFCSGPVPAPNGASPSPGPEQKKTPWVVFFFCSGPVPASNGASPSLAFRRGRSNKKNTLGGVFCLLWPRAGFQRGFSFPCLSPGPQQKKNTLGGVFFFAAAPRGRSLTHCGPGWRCLPLAGAVFFFFAAAPPGPGWCFFFAVAPPGRSLTHGGLGRFRQGPGGVFFFCCGPAGSF